MTRQFMIASSWKRIAGLISGMVAPAIGLGLLTLGPAAADTWAASNTLSRVVVHAFCGNPTSYKVKKDSKGCFCGNHFSYKIGDGAGQAINCASTGQPDNFVPNYAHKATTEQQILKALVSMFYGGRVKNVGFCMILADGTCQKKDRFTGIGNPVTDEAFYVGHLVAALVGKENCAKASQNFNASQWAMDTALAELRPDGIKQLQDDQVLMKRFRSGCENDDYLAVWQWIKDQ